MRARAMPVPCSTRSGQMLSPDGAIATTERARPRRANSRATRAPSELPSTCTRPTPSPSTVRSTASVRAATVGRTSRCGDRPDPGSSTFRTSKRSASAGRTAAKSRRELPQPCSSSSGSPAPERTTDRVAVTAVVYPSRRGRPVTPPTRCAARAPIGGDDVRVTAAPIARPNAVPGAASSLDELADLVADGDVVVLSGAGLSTDSGIPDYRGATGSLRRHTPMTFQTFTRDPRGRHRYWARSFVGWRQIRAARPNDGHRAVADLQAAGLVGGLITQNVDGLHQAGGARDVVELHGGLDRTVCLSCGDVGDRGELDERLRAANPHFGPRADEVNPDGDAELPDEVLDGFVMVDCLACGGGPLKPDVVFFGETVPRDRVEHCFGLVEQARSLLVVGSSLTVMSGYRFVLRAAKLGIPVAIVTVGPTRGDAKADVRLDAPLGTVLPQLADLVAG